MPIQTRRVFINDRENFKQRSHIEYYLRCYWCLSHFWAGRIDAQYCSGACRVQKCVANKNKLK